MLGGMAGMIAQCVEHLLFMVPNWVWFPSLYLQNSSTPSLNTCECGPKQNKICMLQCMQITDNLQSKTNKQRTLNPQIYKGKREIIIISTLSGTYTLQFFSGEKFYYPLLPDAKTKVQSDEITHQFFQLFIVSTKSWILQNSSVWIFIYPYFMSKSSSRREKLVAISGRNQK